MSKATTPTEGSPVTIPKWVYALAVGVPVAAALAYILFGPAADSADKPKKGKKPKPKAAEPQEEKPAVKTVEVEACPEEEGPTDPLGRATAAKNRGNYKKSFEYGTYCPLSGPCTFYAVLTKPKISMRIRFPPRILIADRIRVSPNKLMIPLFIKKLPTTSHCSTTRVKKTNNYPEKKT